MASNLSTDLSILNAPKKSWVWVHQTKGPNRQERRHGTTTWGFVDKDGNKHDSLYGAKAMGAFKGKHRVHGHLNRQDFALRYPSNNEPYRKPLEPPTNKSRMRRLKRKLRWIKRDGT